MGEIIQLLPDHLANQIAAGEVIQRPASVVKELLENAIDAQATEIQLIVKDAGKELIQVIDNGSGMSPMDLRMCFERHATSKIREIDDLFAIKTMGFRGEALASMAAVAQIEVKSRMQEEEVGNMIRIEASEVKLQEPIAAPIGTNFSVKNLFYNVPARRKFLKSNTSEFKHILDEFTRVAMAYPEISFRLFHNNTEQFHLNSENLKSRIVGLLGTKFEKHLVPVSEDTELLKISGFIGKPEAAIKTRGNQFFFVNNRFIKSHYLNHAVVNAFDGLIEKETFPFYILFLELNPERVDINVHPSKQEVKFDDESLMYAYIHAAIKHALAKFNIMPSLDFTLNQEIENLESVKLPISDSQVEKVRSGFLNHTFSQGGQSHFIGGNQERKEWENQREALFPEMPKANHSSLLMNSSIDNASNQELPFEMPVNRKQSSLLWGNYIISTVKSGFLLIHYKRALERIVYEDLVKKMSLGKPVSQQLLFPIPLEISPIDIPLLEDALSFLNAIGYEIESFGKQDYVIQGAPVGIKEGREQIVFDEVLEQIKIEPSMLKDKSKNRLLVTTSKKIAQTKQVHPDELQSMIDELFACEQPNYAPDGQNIFQILSQEKLASLL